MNSPYTLCFTVLKVHSPPPPHHSSVTTAPLYIFFSQARIQTAEAWFYLLSNSEKKCEFKLNLTSSFGLQVNYGWILKNSKQIGFEIKQYSSGYIYREFQARISSPHFFANCAHVSFWNQTFTYRFHLIYQKCSQLKHYVPLQALQKISFWADPKWWLKKYHSVQQIYLRKK